MSQAKTKPVVFIAASPHSGSTLLESMLCSHPGYVGLGEAFQLVDPRNNRLKDLAGEQCSCGERIEACPFWGRTTMELRNHPEWSPRHRYEFLLGQAHEVFGGDRVIVDSSKTPAAIRLLKDVPTVDLRVIHLIKDVRAWTVSMQDIYRRNPDFRLNRLIKQRAWKGAIRYLKRNRAYSFHEWYWMQKEIDCLVREKQIPTFRISYERLCLDLKPSLGEICKFLGLEFSDAMLSLSDSDNHNVFGNRMRFQEEKRRGVSYDHRWFYKNDWVLPSLIFPYIMSYNRKCIYESSPRTVWER